MLAVNDPMLLESMDDMVDNDVLEYLPELGAGNRALLAASQRGRRNGLEFDDTNDDDELWNYPEDPEDEDMSSDPPHARNDNSSGLKDVHADPNDVGKRKASLECIEDAGPQKKARMETEGEEMTDPDTTVTTTKPQQSLYLKQKTYLVEKLTKLQSLKYAAPFVAEDSAGPMNLNTVLVKLLEDKYPSVEALQDDVQLAVQIVAPESGSKKAKLNAGKLVLAYVDRFMERLPKGRPNEGAKGDSAGVTTRKPNRGPTEAQQREKRYAVKQVEAFRSGKQSNLKKTPRNLVAIKIAKERAESVKAKEKKRKLGGLTKFMLGTQQNDKKSAEDNDLNGQTDIGGNGDDETTSDPTSDAIDVEDSEDDEINDDPVGNEEQRDREVEDVETDPAEREADKKRANKSYEEHLSELSVALPTQQQLAELDRSATTGPNFVGRTASMVCGWKFEQYHKKTNGHTSSDVLLPAADSRNRKYCSHQHLAEMKQGEIKYMVGNHLVWKDLVADEFLSYTKCAFFLVVHGLRRYHEAQGDVTIQYFDRRKAQNPDGRSTKFYVALDIFTAFDVPKWDGWGDSNNIKLHPRKFTQEYLTHGPVLTPNTIFKQARVEDLIRDGLYEIFPEFEAPEDHKRAGLYTLQVVYRKIGYPPAPHAASANADDSQTNVGTRTSATVEAASSLPSSSDASSSTAGAPGPDASVSSPGAETSGSGKPKTKTRKVAPPIYSYDHCARQTAMTVKLLETVRKVTLNFRLIPEGVDASTIEPPLHAFISFLTFEKRPKADPVFLEWIRERYTGM
jgi:hypothetical protein